MGGKGSGSFKKGDGRRRNRKKTLSDCMIVMLPKGMKDEIIGYSGLGGMSDYVRDAIVDKMRHDRVVIKAALDRANLVDPVAKELNDLIFERKSKKGDDVSDGS